MIKKLPVRKLVRHILDREDGILPYIHKRTNEVKVFHKNDVNFDHYSIMIEEELEAFDYDALEMIVELQNDLAKKMGKK